MDGMHATGTPGEGNSKRIGLVTKKIWYVDIDHNIRQVPNHEKKEAHLPTGALVPNHILASWDWIEQTSQ